MSLTKVSYSMVKGAPVNVLDFGAVGNGITDDTAAIQLAINATPTGGLLFIPVGTYLVTNTLTCSLPITLNGEGTGSVILVDAAVSVNIDIIRVYPTGASPEVKDFFSFQNFYIKPVSGTPGRYGIHIDASAVNIAQTLIDRVWIAKLGNVSIYADGANTSSLFHITNCQIMNGISIPTAGDTIWITGNQITGDTYGLNITFTSGALLLMLVGNNITSKYGVHIGAPANFSVISDNEFETFATFLGSNGSVVDIDGNSVDSVNDFVISRNSFSIINSIVAYAIRVNYANRTSITDNRFFRSSGVQTLINITSNANNTYVGTNMFDNSGPFSQMITNNGVNTVIAAAFLANFIIPSNNVGIGTAAPSNNASLEIQTSAATPALWVQTGGTTASYTIADFRNGSNVPVLQALGNNTVFVNSLGTGIVYSNAGILTSTNPSDERLKIDIEDLSFGLANILALRPVSYQWKTDKIDQGTQYGFIAQEVQSVIPDLIREFETKDGTRYGIEKEGIYVAMVKAIQELTARVADLEAK